jgi:hypothetical protein
MVLGLCNRANATMNLFQTQISYESPVKEDGNVNRSAACNIQAIVINGTGYPFDQ